MPLLEGARAVADFGVKGGVGDDGWRACDDVGLQRHGASPGGGHAVDDVNLKGGGVDDGRRACDDVGRQQHGASPVGGVGRQRRGPQGRRRRWQEGLRRNQLPTPQRLSRRG